MAYRDSFAKYYERKYAVVVTVFCVLSWQNKDPSSTHQRMVCANYGCAEAMIISHDNDFQTKREIELYNSSTEKKIKIEKRTKSEDEDKTASV